MQKQWAVTGQSSRWLISAVLLHSMEEKPAVTTHLPFAILFIYSSKLDKVGRKLDILIITLGQDAVEGDKMVDRNKKNRSTEIKWREGWRKEQNIILWSKISCVIWRNGSVEQKEMSQRRKQKWLDKMCWKQHRPTNQATLKHYLTSKLISEISYKPRNLRGKGHEIKFKMRWILLLLDTICTTHRFTLLHNSTSSKNFWGKSQIFLSNKYRPDLCLTWICHFYIKGPVFRIRWRPVVCSVVANTSLHSPIPSLCGGCETG